MFISLSTILCWIQGTRPEFFKLPWSLYTPNVWYCTLICPIPSFTFFPENHAAYA